ncbi:MAG: hypothetical protein L6R41_005741 [Letrouitia leprolyta]|nr:MAG: hypothetical protein L6R41_005741 [Letrouitia leprolyta]
METSIDPQLRDHAQAASQSYPSLPPTNYPLNPIRLPPPQQHQAPQHPWPQQTEPHLYYPQRTGQNVPTLPQSDNLSYSDVTPQHGEQPPADSKRPRACEACRGLKVRCEPDPAKGTCRRCAKAGRTCVVTAPSRKRQKKTDSRVAELERKIDALTASLHATKAQAASESDDGSTDDRRPLPTVSGQNRRPSDYMAQDNPRVAESTHMDQQRPSAVYCEPTERSPHQPGTGNEKKRRRSQYLEEEMDRSFLAPQSRPFDTESSNAHIARENSGNSYMRHDHHNGRTNSLQSSTSHSISPTHEYADVVDRKLLDASKAAELFEHYTQRMAGHMPLVVFAPDTPAGNIRKNRPTLFLAILSVASGQIYPDLQPKLAKEIMRAFADRIIYKGEKSLELIQALQVMTIWYWPEEIRDAQTYQLIHMAAVMAIDLGLGRRARGGRESQQAIWKDSPRGKLSVQCLDSAESRRAWLGCYLLCANTAMGLRRTNLIRWNAYMDDCLDFLNTSPDALLTDLTLIEWVRLQRLADDAGNQISEDDTSNVGVSDVKTQYALKGFERQMKDWEKQASKQTDSLSLTFNFHVANLYMHEFGTHLDQTLDFPNLTRTSESKDKKSKARPQVLTTAQISALTTCLTSIHGMFDTVLKISPEEVRNVPVFFFVRVSYAGIFLIKMYFAATSADSELGKVISSDDMRVEYYLGKLRELLQASGGSGKKCRVTRSFFLVLVMFQTWFERQKDGKGNISQEFTNSNRHEAQPVDVEKHAPEAEYKRMQLNGDAMPVRRPSVSHGAPAASVEGMDQSRLHVLGEVALGNSSSSGPSMNQGNNNWAAYPAGPMGNNTSGFMGYDYGTTVHQLNMGGYETDMSGYQLGLEQAMGMTFNEGNLSYVDDYALYNMMQMPNMFENSV